MPASNVTLYAKWTKNSYQVNFDSQGGSVVPAESVEFEGKVPEPVAPTREGYTFGGWYKEADCQNAWDFTTEKMPASNVTLYAKWLLNSFELNNVPTIIVNNKVLTVGDEFNPLDGVRAFDKEDGDIILTEANIISNDVDMSKPGTYSVTYKVTDSKGASSIKTTTVIVNPKIEILNVAPVINAEDKEILLGNEFKALDGITANDREDGDITNKIKVISNNVDINKEGSYEVIYEVEDNQGAKTTKKIIVKVISKNIVEVKPEVEKPNNNMSNENLNQVKPVEKLPNTGAESPMPILGGLSLIVGSLMAMKKRKK